MSRKVGVKGAGRCIKRVLVPVQVHYLARLPVEAPEQRLAGWLVAGPEPQLPQPPAEII